MYKYLVGESSLSCRAGLEEPSLPYVQRQRDTSTGNDLPGILVVDSQWKYPILPQVCLTLFLLTFLASHLVWEATCMHMTHENTDRHIQQRPVNHTFIRYCWDAHSTVEERERGAGKTDGDWQNKWMCRGKTERSEQGRCAKMPCVKMSLRLTFPVCVTIQISSVTGTQIPYFPSVICQFIVSKHGDRDYRFHICCSLSCPDDTSEWAQCSCVAWRQWEPVVRNDDSYL